VSDRTLFFAPIDFDAVEMVLCDADGNLFDTEEAAFVASTAVTNRLLRSLGSDRSYSPDALRRWAMGRNFRSTASALAAEAGVALGGETLERWVAAERRAVVAELAAQLRPDPGVRQVLDALSGFARLAVVTSSAAARLDACLTATGLDDLFPTEVRFSAEDSLPMPTSKPDPAVYQFAGRQMDVSGPRALAVEDAVAGVRSAVAAGFPTIGNMHFVPRHERLERVRWLREAGAVAIVPSWAHLASVLRTGQRGRVPLR
jgi:HAD superfamily hydrolase (TIGR01509 family)